MRRVRFSGLVQEATLLGTVVVLALVVWFVITDAENQEIEQPLGFSLPVRVLNLASGLASANDPLPVSVTVVGKRSALESVSPDDFSATIDARGRAAGQHSLPVRAESLREDVRVRAVQPETAVLTFQELVEREVPVRVETANPPPLGFRVDELTVDPDRVIITGIAQDVEQVAAAVARMDLAAATVSLEADVQLEARTSSGAAVAGIEVRPRFARVTAPITQEVFRRLVAVRPVVQGIPRSGYRVLDIRVEPPTVELLVPLGGIGDDEAIPTEVIDITDRRTSVRRLVPLDLGESATAGQTEVLVTVTIEVIEATVRLSTAVLVEGLADGMEVLLISPELVGVELRGPAEDVALLEGPLEVVVADVSGLGPGRHTVEITATAPAGMTVIGLLPRVVTVVLISTPEPAVEEEEEEGADE